MGATSQGPTSGLGVERTGPVQAASPPGPRDGGPEPPSAPSPRLPHSLVAGPVLGTRATCGFSRTP